MKTSDRGRDLIKEFEALKLRAYLCPAGKPTIGYGHTAGVTAEDVRRRRTITEAEANELLEADLRTFEAGVLKACMLHPTQHQFDALVSFAFNVGLAALKRSSVLRHHNAGKPQQAAAAFGAWKKARVGPERKLTTLPGLVRRRAAEAALYLRPSFAPMPAQILAPVPKPITPAEERAGDVVAAVGLGGVGVGAGALAAVGASGWEGHLASVALLGVVAVVALVVGAGVTAWWLGRRG